MADPPAQANLGAMADPPAQANLGAMADPPAQANLGAMADPPAQANLGAMADPPAQANLGAMADPPAVAALPRPAEAPRSAGPGLPSRPPQDPRAQPGYGRHSARSDSWQDPYARPSSAHGRTGAEFRPAADHELALGSWKPPGARAANGDDGEGRASADLAASAHVQAGRLSDDQAKLVAGLLAACRTAEGRNMFGEYGNSGLTPAIRRIAGQLPRGGLAPGSEADSLKPAERLAAKIARLIARHPGRSAEELAAGIGDAIRYAFTFDPDYYTEGTWLVHRKLKAHGFELEARRNRWDSPEYKGVWTSWRDPAHGLAFEVQFHTGASWDVVRRTHQAYLQITDPATPAAERARLRARQVSAATGAKAPPNAAEISDFGRETR